MAHQPEDIDYRRKVIIFRIRHRMHRRNDIMHRTADIGYRTNNIIYRMNDIGIRRYFIMYHASDNGTRIRPIRNQPYINGFNICIIDCPGEYKKGDHGKMNWQSNSTS